MDYLQYQFKKSWNKFKGKVLNLIINGLPSISEIGEYKVTFFRSFKPYYKWITFNILKTNLDYSDPWEF